MKDWRLFRFIRRVLLLGLFVNTVSLCFIAGWIYTGVTQVKPRCLAHPNESAFTPADFGHDSLNLAPYQMPVYETITFPSRNAKLNLSAFFIPTKAADSRSIVIIHGLSGCKRLVTSLLPAGMLNRAGFQILVVDLRNMGDSDSDNGLQAAGTKEYWDVLGAWDWLVNERGVLPEHIGLYGYSLGGASALIAAGQESRITAVWTDSAFADPVEVINAQLNNPLLSGFAALSVTMGQLISGDNLRAKRPVDEIQNWAEQQLFLVHGDMDTTIPIEQAYQLETTARSAQVDVQLWVTTGSGHVESMFDYTEEYESRLVTFFKTALK